MLRKTTSWVQMRSMCKFPNWNCISTSSSSKRGNKSFRIFKGHLYNRKQKLCIYEKAKTIIIPMQCLKSKNLILLNIWGIFAWRLENLVCVPISLIAATFSTFISISFSFLFIIHPTALPRWGRLINSNRNLNSQPTISFISRDCSDYAFLQSTKWGTILCLQETFRTQ